MQKYMHLGNAPTTVPYRLPTTHNTAKANETDSKLYNGRLLVYQNDLNKSAEQQTIVTPPKMPPDIAKTIDESNYVKLSSITTAIANAAEMANGNGRTHNHHQLHHRVDASNGKTPIDNDDINDSDKINELDNKANLLNNFYANSNGFANNMMSIVNQKNLNNLNNLYNNNNNANTTITATTTTAAAAAIVNNNNNNVLTNAVDLTKSNSTNGSGNGTSGGPPIDYNQNGLPVIPKAPPLPGSMAHVVPGENRNAACNGNAQQSFVIKSNGSSDIVIDDETTTASSTNDTAKGR